MRNYNIDLTTTANCNFRCSYCFENTFFRNKNFDQVELFTKRVDELLDSTFFKKNYEKLTIHFWGGEPTLNPECIRYVFNHYKDNDYVSFFLFTNGSNLDPLMDIFIENSKKMVVGNQQKITIQISYDGKPLQDIHRKNKSNKLTGDATREVICNMLENKIPTILKSTLTTDSFKYLSDARNDIFNIFKKYPQNDLFREGTYFPTIDYHNLNKYNNEEIENSYKVLEEQLLIVAKEEVKFFKKNNRFFFVWFNNNKALCSGGRDVVTIDWDGKVYKCHGCLYSSNKEQHCISNLTDDTFVYDLEKSHDFHNFNFSFEPLECKQCIATFCLRCNVEKFECSNKNDYLDKWRDYTNQSTLCNYFKINGKVSRALKQIL